MLARRVALPTLQALALPQAQPGTARDSAVEHGRNPSVVEWKTVKIKTIKQRHDVGIWLQLTAEMDRGRYVVEMRPDDGASDGTLLTASEARRLAKALDAFADAADKSNERPR